MHHNVSQVNMQGRSRSALCEDTVVPGCCNPWVVRWIRGILPIVTWVAYLVVGAAIFEAVEKPEALIRMENQANKQKETNDTIVSLFEQLFAFTNGSMNMAKHDQILAELVGILKESAMETNEVVASQEARWEFMESAVFCMTVISTIGYGYLSPKTQTGRGLCIVYALIGIPLNIIVMAGAGNVLARGIRYLHRRLKHCLFTLKTWRKVGPPKQQTAPSRGVDAKTSGNTSTNGGQDNRGFQLQIRRADLSTPDSVRNQSNPDGNGTKSNGNAHDNNRRLSQCSDIDAPVDAINDPNFPVYLLIIAVLMYVVVFALLLWYSEMGRWSILDSFYFIIITITTIGFGDLRNQKSKSSLSFFENFMAIATPIVGMVLLSAVISVAINKFGRKTKMIEDKICGKH